MLTRRSDERSSVMADKRHRKPDYRVTFPVNGVWHKLGAAWKNDGGTINVVLDVGVPITIHPGNKLVLVPPKEDEAE
jgi:hypothetical protein